MGTDDLLALVGETRRKIVEAADDLAKLTDELRRRVLAVQLHDDATQETAAALEQAVNDLTVQHLRVEHMHLQPTQEEPCDPDPGEMENP